VAAITRSQNGNGLGQSGQERSAAGQRGGMRGGQPSAVTGPV
jgi:hypothetical protein